MPEDILAVLKPEYVAPLVMYLCHEVSEETGSLFEVGGGWIGKVRWQKSSGALVKRNDQMTPEDVQENWAKITGFETPLYHTAIGEATNHCFEVATGQERDGKSWFNHDFINPFVID